MGIYPLFLIYPNFSIAFSILRVHSQFFPPTISYTIPTEFPIVIIY